MKGHSSNPLPQAKRTKRADLSGRPSPAAWETGIQEVRGHRWAWPPTSVGVSLNAEVWLQSPGCLGVWQTQHQPPSGPIWPALCSPSCDAKPSSLAPRVVQMISTGSPRLSPTK